MNKFITENEPTKEELLNFLGEAKPYYLTLESSMLENSPNIQVMLHNTGSGGWTIKHYLKKKYVAQFNIFEGCFDFMCRFDEDAVKQIFAIESKLRGYGKIAWGNRYPCGSGFWIHLLVKNKGDLEDALLFADILVKSKG